MTPDALFINDDPTKSDELLEAIYSDWEKRMEHLHEVPICEAKYLENYMTNYGSPQVVVEIKVDGLPSSCDAKKRLVGKEENFEGMVHLTLKDVIDRIFALISEEEQKEPKKSCDDTALDKRSIIQKPRNLIDYAALLSYKDGEEEYSLESIMNMILGNELQHAKVGNNDLSTVEIKRRETV